MGSMLTTLLLVDAVAKYSDDQARDDHGRWTGEGSGAAPGEVGLFGERQISSLHGVDPMLTNVHGAVQENSIRFRIEGRNDSNGLDPALRNHQVVEVPRSQPGVAKITIDSGRSAGYNIRRLPDSPSLEEMKANMASHGHYANLSEMGRNTMHEAFPRNHHSSTSWHELARQVQETVI